MMVNVTSMELEKVLVEQNHCHGLNIIMKSWHCEQKHPDSKELLNSRLPK
jgi:hypothetical protein